MDNSNFDLSNVVPFGDGRPSSDFTWTQGINGCHCLFARNDADVTVGMMLHYGPMSVDELIDHMERIGQDHFDPDVPSQGVLLYEKTFKRDANRIKKEYGNKLGRHSTLDLIPYSGVDQREQSEGRGGTAKFDVQKGDYYFVAPLPGERYHPSHRGRI